MSKNYEKAEIKKISGSTVEISVSVSEKTIEPLFKDALRDIAKTLDIPGFRKGKVPENIALDRVGEMNVLLEASELAIQKALSEIIEKEKIKIVGNPDVSIKKLAPKNPLEFSAKISVFPEIDLADYKKIAKEANSKPKESLELSEKEIDDVIKEIRQRSAHAELDKKGLPHKETELEEKDLPEINDDFVKTLGDFKDVADFRAKIKENILKEKEQRASEKKRADIFEKLISESKMDLPEVLVQNEIDRMILQFKSEISSAGISYEDYLKHINKKEEDIKNEWRKDAEKRASIQLILSEIAEKEKLSPESETIRKETEKLLILHKDADPLRARAYIKMMLENEMVIKFLEEQK